MNHLNAAFQSLHVGKSQEQKKLTAQELHDAIKGNFTAAMASQIQSNTVNELVAGKCAMHLAIEKGDDTAVALLVKHRPDLTIQEQNTGNTCFHLAALKNSAPMLRELGTLAKPGDLEQKNAQGFTPFFLACMEGKDQGARELLSMDARIDATEPVHGQTALHHAAANGHTAIVLLFRNKLDAVNAALSQGWPGATPLHAACLKGKLETALALLDIGASIEATYTCAKTSGKTVLHVAASHDKLWPVVSRFNDRPDILNAIAGGRTAQDIAVEANCPLFIKELFKCGVKPDLSRDLKSFSTAIGKIYLEFLPSRVQLCQTMASSPSCSLEQEKEIVKCLNIYSKLKKYPNLLPMNDEITASCARLFEFIAVRQEIRIDAARAVVTGSDSAATEEDLLQLLETLSFQHLLVSSVEASGYPQLGALSASSSILFDPLGKLLETLACHIEVEMLFNRDIKPHPVQKEKIKRIAEQLCDIQQLQSRLFSGSLLSTLQSRITPFLKKCQDILSSNN